MREKIRSSRGYTLVELTVVIAIIAIIVTMVTTFISFYRKNVERVQQINAIASDTNLARQAIDEWVTAYDVSNWMFTGAVKPEDGTAAEDAEDDKLVAYVAKMSNPGDNFSTIVPDYGKPCQALSYDAVNNALVWETDKAGEDAPGTVRRSYAFEAVTDCQFYHEDHLIKCYLTFESGHKQALVYVIFSETTRDRYSTNLPTEEPEY